MERHRSLQSEYNLVRQLRPHTLWSVPDRRLAWLRCLAIVEMVAALRTIQSEEINLEVVHPDATGIDIGNEVHYISVPPGRDSEPVRHFGCTTAELKAMADWLKQCGIRTVAMQSTGVYWIAVFDILEEARFEVFLVNARDTKNLPGRKSDVQESQ